MLTLALFFIFVMAYYLWPTKLNLNKGVKEIIKFNWNDKYFEDEFVLKLGVRYRPDLNQSVECCKAFMNWYTCGDDIGDVSLIIAGIFGQATKPQSADYLFDSALFNVQNGDSIPRFHGVQRQNVSNYPCKNERDLKAIIDWYFAIYAFLDDSEQKKKAVINYLSYLAMTMLRCAKSPSSFSKRVDRVSEEVVRFWKYPVRTIKVTPPPRKSVLFDKNLQRYGFYLARCLTFVVASHGACPESENNTSGVIFRTACLLNLRLTGMDCYRYTAEAAKILGLQPDQISIMLQLENNKSVVDSFLNQYVDPNSNEKSWPWACLLKKDSFQQLSLEYDPMFALTMATIALGEDVKKVMSFKRYENKFSEASIRANRIRSLLEKNQLLNQTVTQS